MKKSHSKLSKNEHVCICKEGWCVGLGQEGVVCVRWGELSEISDEILSEMRGIEKRVEEAKC